MSCQSVNHFDEGTSFVSNFSLTSFSSNPLHHQHRYSLVKCPIIVGDLPPIPNRIRALARVIQNADPLQFPDLRNKETSELNESAVSAILKELGVTLSSDEERVFPVALRECKRTLWRATVYGRKNATTSESVQQPQHQREGDDDFDEEPSNQNNHPQNNLFCYFSRGGLGRTIRSLRHHSHHLPDSSKVRCIAKVLEICNSIDIEAAFAGAALGAIPDSVLAAYPLFTRIAGMDRAFTTQEVLLRLFECTHEPLTKLHQIIRDHNMYQTRRHAVFSQEEVRDIAVENEKLNYVVAHLELILKALDLGADFSVSAMFDDKFVVSAWNSCFGDHIVAVPMPNYISDEAVEEAGEVRNDDVSAASLKSDPLHVKNRNKSFDDFEQDESVELFFEHFPPWSRAMLRAVMDYQRHGVLSVFSLQRALQVWGPSTLMPFNVASDLRKKRFLLGCTPAAAQKHISLVNKVVNATALSAAGGVDFSASGNNNDSSNSSKARDEFMLPAKGAYALCLGSRLVIARGDGEESGIFDTKRLQQLRHQLQKNRQLHEGKSGADVNVNSGDEDDDHDDDDDVDGNDFISIFVKTKRKDGELKVRDLEMHRSDGVWKIDGVTSASGLGGFETIGAAIGAFQYLFEHACGTEIEVIEKEYADLQEKRQRRRERLQKLNRLKNDGDAQDAFEGRQLWSSTGSRTSRQERASKSHNDGDGGDGDGDGGDDNGDDDDDDENDYDNNNDVHENPFGEVADFSDSTSLLHRAVYSCNIPLVKKLLASGSEGIVNCPQPDEVISGGEHFWTPLVYACCTPVVSKCAECCSLLTSHGADVSFADSLGRTALFYAILNGHADAVAHLLRRNPKLQASGTTISPLFVAIGAHWLHPDINDVHALSGVKISADVIRAILFNGDQSVDRDDVLAALDILEVKERGTDLKYANMSSDSSSSADAAKCFNDFKQRHSEMWRLHATMIRDVQRERLKSSIVAHGAFMRSEPDGFAELHRAKRCVQNFLLVKSCQDLVLQVRDVRSCSSTLLDDYLSRHATSTLYERGNNGSLTKILSLPSPGP